VIIGVEEREEKKLQSAKDGRKGIRKDLLWPAKWERIKPHRKKVRREKIDTGATRIGCPIQRAGT